MKKENVFVYRYDLDSGKLDSVETVMVSPYKGIWHESHELKSCRKQLGISLVNIKTKDIFSYSYVGKKYIAVIVKEDSLLANNKIATVITNLIEKENEKIRDSEKKKDRYLKALDSFR